jgi:hypothetical protein
MVVAPLVDLTEDAQSELDRYLRRLRAALRSHPSVDADEIERDIRGHIEADLAEGPRPISQARVRSVLERLGSPSQWVPSDELPLWRKVLVRLRGGPEDWRLAYVTFALFIVGPLAGPIGPLFFFASIPLARATLALLEQEGEPVGARGWLIYPPLIFIYAAIVMAALFAGPGLVGTAADPSVLPVTRSWFPEPLWLSLALVVGLGAGVWWTLLGLLLARFTRAVHLLFWPFANWFERRHGMRIVFFGLTVSVVAASGLAALFWSR